MNNLIVPGALILLALLSKKSAAATVPAVGSGTTASVFPGGSGSGIAPPSTGVSNAITVASPDSTGISPQVTTPGISSPAPGINSPAPAPGINSPALSPINVAAPPPAAPVTVIAPPSAPTGSYPSGIGGGVAYHGGASTTLKQV